jgi:hypothetical protein
MKFQNMKVMKSLYEIDDTNKGGVTCKHHDGIMEQTSECVD